MAGGLPDVPALIAGTGEGMPTRRRHTPLPPAAIPDGAPARFALPDGADPRSDRLREPAAAGGRASVSEGSDAAGSDLGVWLPVGAPHGSNEGVGGKDYGPITSNGGSGCIRKQGIRDHTFLGPCLRLITALKFLILRPL